MNKLDENTLKELRKCDGYSHGSPLVIWRHNNKDKMRKAKYPGILICPITNQEVCDWCLWDNTGSCYCDFSYG